MRTKPVLRTVVLLALAWMLTWNVSTFAATASGTVTVWVGSWWEPQIPIATQMWAQDYPGVTLKIEPLPINGYLDKFVASALGGTPPDVIDLDATWVSTAAAKGLLQPLDALTKSLDVKDYSPSVWASSRYNGHQYAIPNRASANVFYYNKTVFDKAGAAYPTDTWTFGDMLQIARKVTTAGQYGVGVAADLSDPSNAMDLLSAVIWAYGGDFLNKDSTKATINSPKSVQALTFWADLYTKYHVAPEGTPNFTTTRDLLPLFEANKVGMITGSSNIFDELSKHKDLRWGVVLSPSKVNRSGGWTMGVPVGAQNAAAAQVFLLWLAKPANMGKIMNRTPARLSVYNAPPWNDPKYVIFAKALRDARSLPTVGNWASIQTVIITDAQKILVGQMTPQQAADAMATQIDALLAKK
ncbi:MAG TPA: sugar ABC transporter substrate-binding protein [bacterium]|nr:sugar ABC transporter substrate-binding protein [bacterium]